MTRPFTRSQIILEGLAVPLAVVAVPGAFGVIVDWAMPSGPALSPPVEPVPVSLASPLQSLSQGER